MKIEIAKKNISQLIHNLSEDLLEAQMIHKQYHKGKNGQLYFKSHCECGGWLYKGIGIDFKTANKNQQEYIHMLQIVLKRLSNAQKSITKHD